MKVKTIPSTWIAAEGRRLDSGPFMSGALEARMMLSQLACPVDRLREVTRNGMAGIVNAGRIKRLWVNDPAYGIPFLSSSDILQSDLSYAALISNKVVAENPQLAIRQGWTLITRSGTIGRMAYTRPDMDGMGCSEHVMRVIADSERIPSGYLYAFLSSKYGVPMVVGGTYGSIIQSIEPAHIADLPVPRLGEALEGRVHALVEAAAQLLSQYQARLLEATDLFFASVGMQDLRSWEWHAQGPDLSFVQLFPRQDSLRALNYNPRYKRLRDNIHKSDWLPLAQICEPGTLHRGGRYKRIDAAPAYSYQLIGQKQLFSLRPEGRFVAKSALGDDVLVESGTILIAARGTLGESELYCRAELIQGPAIQHAYSEDLLRVVANDSLMPKGCLYAYIRSETFFRMLRSISFGSKLQDHHRKFLAQLPVPVPPKDTQQEINDLIVQAYNARHRAIALEDEARALVEQAIEGAA